MFIYSVNFEIFVLTSPPYSNLNYVISSSVMEYSYPNFCLILFIFAVLIFKNIFHKYFIIFRVSSIIFTIELFIIVFLSKFIYFILVLRYFECRSDNKWKKKLFFILKFARLFTTENEAK